MEKNEIAISVKALEKSYKDIQVLRKVDFSIRKGTIFALLGPNGAGKTTIIKILSTLLKPDNGEVKIFGYDVVRQANEVRRKISMTGQFTSIDELMTGRENMFMIAKLLHIPEHKAVIDEIMKKFELYDAADKRVAAYSGGMRRKLDLAMSLLGKPAMIFLDEPTTGLDPQSRIALWKIIKELKNTGVAILLTTQYLGEAEKLGDQIAILNEGKIIANGTVEELKRILPHEVIELKFNQKEQMEAAHKLLRDFNPRSNEPDMTMALATDGSIKQIARIFDILNRADMHIESFRQIIPTLEDAFLSIIDKNQVQGGTR